jgi:hypothetical protein
VTIRIINLTTMVGFTDKALDILRSNEHVHQIVDAKPSDDGRYHDISLHVTKEFADFVVAYVRDELDDVVLN